MTGRLYKWDIDPVRIVQDQHDQILDDIQQIIYFKSRLSPYGSLQQIPCKVGDLCFTADYFRKDMEPSSVLPNSFSQQVEATQVSK